LLAVKTTVATPALLVVLVGVAKLPPLLLAHVTTRPAVATGVPCASASCAVIVTVPPATTLDALEVTTYRVAAAATAIAPLFPVKDPVVAVTTWLTPPVALAVKLTIAMPLA